MSTGRDDGESVERTAVAEAAEAAEGAEGAPFPEATETTADAERTGCPSRTGRLR